MTLTTRPRWAAVGLTTAALAVALAGPASAASVQPPLATGLVGPLGLAVQPDGTAYVAQSFINVITKISPDGTRTDLPVDAQGAAGLSPEPDGSLVYTYSIHDDPDSPHPVPPTGQLRRLSAAGKTTVLGYIGQYENRANPDKVNAYGFQGLTPACAKTVPAFIGGYPYTGLKDTHPYAVARLAGGAHVVADAGANALLKVANDGTVSTLAVLPPAPVTITVGEAHGLGLPDCTIGKVYAFEPVPTDVTLGPDGWLYVSTLTGGPEDGSLGALSRIFRVNPNTGAYSVIGSGFAGATGIAVGTGGRVYVAELYAGRISYVKAGAPATVVDVAAPGAVEFARGKLFATVDVLPGPSGPPDGKVISIGF